MAWERKNAAPAPEPPLGDERERPDEPVRTLPRIARGVAYGVQRTHANWQSGIARKKFLPPVKD